MSDSRSVWWTKSSQRVAFGIVRDYGWHTMQWPLVRRLFPRWVRWTVHAIVAYALGRGVVEAVR